MVATVAVRVLFDNATAEGTWDGTVSAYLPRYLGTYLVTTCTLWNCVLTSVERPHQTRRRTTGDRIWPHDAQSQLEGILGESVAANEEALGRNLN